MTYVPNKWITNVLTDKIPTNKWTYERSHKSLNLYSLVEYNKIYLNTNSWKTMQEERLWQVDFDNLYFWNALNKTHQGIFVWNRNNRLHTSIRNICIKKEKKQHMVRVGEKKNIHQYKRNISTMYVKTVTRPQYTRYDVSKIERKQNTSNPHYIPQCTHSL